MIGKLRWLLGSSETGDDLLRSPKWREIEAGTKLELAERTNEGVQVDKKYYKKLRNIDTGEIAEIYRSDVKTHWFGRSSQHDWPEEVYAVEEDGVVRKEEVSPDFWFDLAGSARWIRDER